MCFKVVWTKMLLEGTQHWFGWKFVVWVWKWTELVLILLWPKTTISKKQRLHFVCVCIHLAVPVRTQWQTFWLSMWLLFLRIDIPECTNGEAPCLQSCVETPGSYECDCHVGYSLSGDGYSCIGKSWTVYTVLQCMYGNFHINKLYIHLHINVCQYIFVYVNMYIHM